MTTLYIFGKAMYLEAMWSRSNGWRELKPDTFSDEGVRKAWLNEWCDLTGSPATWWAEALVEAIER